MEEPQEPGPGVGAPFSFPPHRRSHLRSGTYRNLVRLISLCYGDSPLATAPPIIPLPQTPENGSNQGEPGGDDARDPGGSIVLDNREPANMVAQEGKAVDGGFEGAVFRDRGFSDTQMVIDEIEQIMQVEGQDLLNQNDLMVNSDMEATRFRDGEIGREQMLMTELENIMKGNEDCDKSSNCLTTSFDWNGGDNCVGVSVTNQEEHDDHPPVVMEESGTVGQPQVDMEGGNTKIIEAFGFSSDKSMTVEVSKSSEKVEDQSSLSKTNATCEKIEIQQKEMELEKFVCSNDRLASPGHMVEDGELEEGEIFGDIQLVNDSVDTLLDNAVVSEKKVEEKQVSVGAFDDKHLHCNEESKDDDKDPEFTSFNTNVARIANRVTEGELEGSERDQMVFELGTTPRKEGSGNIQKQIGSSNQAIKANKKKNKRKKRAERNRQLGVKRLKLQTVLKPKTVTYCRHYLKGRCYEGEKCKYSHDTVPLTKSQPCSHFARHSCLKGDECPFDHQLSKYPCINYMTKGFCGRGDDCLFSHKMSPAGDGASLSNAHELQPKPSLQGDSDMRLNIGRTSHKNVDASSCSVGAVSHKSKKQIVAETPTKTPDLACKGVNSLFVSKSSMVESSKLNQGSSSQKINESGRVGIQSIQSTLGVNSPFASKPSVADSSKFSQGRSSLKMNESGRLGIQANQSELGTIQNVNDSPKRKTEVVPRGINFLSFGKSSLEDSNSKVSFALNRADGYKQHPSENEGNRGKLSNQTTQSTSSTDQKKTHPVLLPPGINLLSLGKPGISGSGLPCSSDNVNNGSLQKSNYAADKQHNSSAISSKLSISPQTSGQFSEWLAHKNAPNSAQKSLISTLAVAKKFDNTKGRSVHESQHMSDKQYNSNANPWKMPASSLATSQSSEKMTPKNTPNSAQKALMSTLAVAAKLESGMMKNQSPVSSAVNSEIRDGRIGEGSKTDSAKTSKILDILCSLSSKIKHT
ncbi:zinc finger CCCH domain-containing protein 65-like isoform X2 [Durio zibethinus]|uniref:Zinc finger CCCH domain-containing protein 65-like isoform X2 n=1 Tax=Durio zibethinus TaxID=66656 RepID=A0A6P5ZR18_DURZI|nr:zinc finger CCCH domain-containing protein 65-like isoform X2 [Durio zibethinus]